MFTTPYFSLPIIQSVHNEFFQTFDIRLAATSLIALIIRNRDFLPREIHLHMLDLNQGKTTTMNIPAHLQQVAVRLNDYSLIAAAKQ
ncbi:MAG: hypothetical protein COZ36_10335 [Piscirickettsiaceae bacterium CG_4_10_14_3_um_filter_44_349]|nr:MAG: hypothetical protein COZ36_10335 [Piscirickettsiaceae bacterium CG_4_10_14_3_um_filter_44_349]